MDGNEKNFSYDSVTYSSYSWEKNKKKILWPN